MADLTGGSDSPNSASRRASRRTSFNPPSRRSTNQRIDDILETARERAENMAPPESHSPYDTTGSGATSPATRHVPGQGYEDSSADERTGLVNSQPARKSRFDPNASTGPRRKSIYDRGQRDGSGVQHPTSQEQHDDNDDTSHTNGDPVPSEQKTWSEKVFNRFQSIELENKGSVARDHLALERTFLAWLRTSLAFASIGIAVTQLFRLNTSLTGNEPSREDGRAHALRHMGKPLGATFLTISVLTLIMGYRRYLQGQEWVIKGKFPASRGTVLILVFMTLAIMILSLVVVIVIHPSEDGDL